MSPENGQCRHELLGVIARLRTALGRHSRRLCRESASALSGLRADRIRRLIWKRRTLASVALIFSAGSFSGPGGGAGARVAFHACAQAGRWFIFVFSPARTLFIQSSRITRPYVAASPEGDRDIARLV